MQRPTLLRAVYAELRSSLGAEPSGGDLLRLAHLIVLAADHVEPDETEEGGGGSQPFFTWPVDNAMSDGGWRILALEKDVFSLEDSGLNIAFNTRSLIEKYLGPEWQHPELTRPL